MIELKSLGVHKDDYREFVGVTIELSVKEKRPISYREAFSIIVKHYKGCKNAKV